jgi:hypothetical protein
MVHELCAVMILWKFLFDHWVTGDACFTGMRPGENSLSRPSQVSERGGIGPGISRESRGNIRGRRYIQAETHRIKGTNLCWYDFYETRNTKFCEEYVMFPLLNLSQDTIVSVVTMYGLGVEGIGIQFRVGRKRSFSSPQHTDWLWGPPNLLFKRQQALFQHMMWLSCENQIHMLHTGIKT